MTFRIRALSVVLLLAAASAAAAQTGRLPPRDVRRPSVAGETSTGVIRGRVVAADNGVPVPRAEVSALSGMHDLRTATTNDNGEFELAGMVSGDWYLSVARNGYLTQPVGARRPFQPAQAISLAVGQEVAIGVPLVRAGAITGRVYDETGEPIAGVRMTVMRARMAQQRRVLQPVGAGDLTDDTGAFRIHSLPPGEYYVSGSLRFAPVDSVVQTTHSPTYYPGVGNFAEAQRVVLAPGSEAVVDFPLLPFRTARVSGMVIGSGGSAANAFLNLQSDAGELGVPLGFGGVTTEDGSFTLADIPPGSYTLVATLRDSSNATPEAASIPVTVLGDDVTGLTLVTSKPGMIRGTIVVDAGVTRPVPTDIDVVARAARPGGESTFAEVERGAFDLTAPPGPFHLVVDVPLGWSVKSVTLRNADATDAAIELSGGEQVPARIVITDRVTDVSGAIFGGAPGQPPTVVVFPEDPARWTGERYLRTVAAGEDGRFAITGLPPNMRYLAVAVDALEEGEGEDPDFLSRVRNQAVSFVLAEGEKTVIAVPLLQP